MEVLVLLTKLHPQANNESFAKNLDPMLHQHKKLSRSRDSFYPSLLNKSPEILRLNNLGHILSRESITKTWGGSRSENVSQDLQDLKVGTAWKRGDN